MAVNYVFVFLGEFGYELFNWQGVIRKFSRTLPVSDRVICCSRAHVYPLYETATRYIDISEVDLFKQSVASGYFVIRPEDLNPQSRENRAFDRHLKKELTSFILEELGIHWQQSRLKNLFTRAGPREYTFIFSSDKTTLNGCMFGCDRMRYGMDPMVGNIYDLLDLDNNEFRKIEVPLNLRYEIEQKLGWSLEIPFVLCQTRKRDIVVRSKTVVPAEQLLHELARRTRVVLLSFQTGRRLDSYSAFRDVPNCFTYSARSFVEQACVIHFSQNCIFFTEGDFGSHIYVPPFLGKNVFAIAPQDVYKLGTTPIDFWNRTVFRFGGQILAKESEAVFASQQSVLQIVDEVTAL